MSTGLTLQIKSTSSDYTEKIAGQVGKNLRGGEVIELVSDLGGGKTVFAKGIVAGAGSKDEVTSPTFTISKVYIAPKFAIHHFDFYRLFDPGVVKLELQEAMKDAGVVVVVEWGKIVEKALPKKRLIVEIKPVDENSRSIKISAHEDLKYLLEGVNK
jgi:tRNA threonylcarbamoyladenosine biosynthesis protein TsaE